MLKSINYPELPNQFGWTPVHEAAKRDRQSILEYFHERNANLNIKTYSGWTPFQIAAAFRSYFPSRFLFKHKSLQIDPSCSENSSIDEFKNAFESPDAELRVLDK